MAAVLPAPDATSTPHRILVALARWGGLALHIGIGVFPLSASSLITPTWATYTILVVWALALVGAGVVSRRRPLLTPIVPAATLAAWVGFILLGDRVLGWVA